MSSTESTRPAAFVPTRPFVDSQGTLTIDGLDLPTLAVEHGTPLYLYSAANLRHRLALFQQAFASTPHTICYAVKANSSLAILQLLGRLGAGFDIVSGGELERVRRACPEALTRVVFSGVGKQSWEIDAALAADILLFNVESAEELDLLAARAAALGKQARFALRVNPDVFAETHPYISTGLREHKFGVDINLARDLYRRASIHPSLLATGVSVHIGSQIRAIEPFAQAVARLAALIEDLRADGHAITHIDVGGGLGIDYTAPLAAPSSTSPSFAASPTTAVISTETLSSTSAVISTEVKRSGETPLLRLSSTAPPLSSESESQTVGETFPSASPELSPEQQVAAYAANLFPILTTLNCHLLLEPGRFLVAQAGGLVTRIVGTKQNGAKRFIITDAAMNDLIRPALYQAHHEILPVHSKTKQGSGDSAPSLETVDVVGPVCESGDFFAHDRALPHLATGDLALLLDAGAYGMSQASNYNTRARPAELLIDSGEAHLIRRRETLDDLLAPESLL